MANSAMSLFDEIREKIESLGNRLEMERKKNAVLQTETEILRKDLKDCKKELEQSQKKIEFLTLSHQLASSPQALADARLIISEMIRKIDSAISLIKKDPGNI